MIKPLNEGSSVGVLKVTERAEIKAKVIETLDQYGGVLLEKYITGQEITIGVLEEPPATRNGKDIWALPILELRPKSKSGFYDYEAKYTKGMTEFILPAELPDDLTRKCQELAVKTFRALNCSGYARVDMMVGDGQPYVLEVNTLPGMTDTSDLPAMAQEAGIAYDQLVERILMSAGLDK
jgi:D-alanine-D-alanine ligase